MKALLLALGATLACAQSTRQLEVRGRVVEGAFGIGGVTVTLYEFGHIPALATTRTVFATTSTDATGGFVFDPSRAGEYYVEVQKEGYFGESYAGATVDPIDTIGDAVSLDIDHPLRERRFTLMRLGELRGRIVDEDGNPLAKLNVTVQTSFTSSRGNFFARAVTDQEGYFATAKLRPGDYQVWISPAHRLEILPWSSESDLNAVDQDWDPTSWPDTPLPVSPGASLSVGTIHARKVKYYRAHLSVQSADCAEGEKWIFSLGLETAGIGPSVPCAKELVVRNLAPGSYTLTLTTGGGPGEKRRFAVAPVEVTDRNIEVSMAMSPSADISGRIVAAEGIALPSLSQTRIGVTPIVSSTIGNQLIALDSADKFLIRGLRQARYRVFVDRLDNKFYVKAIRYNGLIAEGGVITSIASGPGQIEIEIDDQAPTIRGLVMDTNKAADIWIVALKWPVSVQEPSLFQPNATTVADSGGSFQFSGLAPGEYRFLALSENALNKLKPDSLIGLAGSLEKVTVERGSSQSISLKIVQP